MRPECACRPWTGLLLAVAWTVAMPLGAQERQWPTRETLPEPVVLVLKLLDAAHARPTTGVVISADGLVLVPADFVSAGDELVVLDGGTDVFRNGRPARTVHRSAESGIAVLAVDGLQRRPATLGQAPVSGTLHLAAFPAAEQLTEGALPLWVALESGAPDPSLPALPGPLLDRCGHLVGYAPGEGTQAPIPLDLLTDTLAGFGLALSTAACGASPAGEPEQPAGSEPATPELTAQPDPPSPPEPENEPIDDARNSRGDVALPELVVDEDTAMPTAPEPAMPPESRQAIAVTAAAVLGLLAWWWLRWRRRGTKPSGEPETIELLPARATEPDRVPASTTSSADGRRLVARLPDGQTVEYGLPESGSFSLVVGRSGDVAIDHASLSREHVAIEAGDDGLWVRDLESTNGTLLGRVPCLPGEVLRWAPGVTLLLGEVAISHPGEARAT